MTVKEYDRVIIDVFATPEEVTADQLSNHTPVALKERKTE